MTSLQFLFLCFIGSAVCAHAEYSRDQLAEKYPGYGKEFIFFPDENGKPMKVYLEEHDSSRILFATNPKKNVEFIFYSRQVPEGYKLHNITDVPRQFSKWKKTKFVTHGWQSSGSSDTCMKIKDAFLKHEDVNVFVVDWHRIAGNIIYPIAMGATPEVGAYYAEFLNNLVDNHGMDPRKLHLIGHSLGAHVSGFAGRAITKKRPARITGLDPALPGFVQGFVKGGRLNTKDARFVDIIHTCAGFLGYKDPIGHADFYPNGGHPPQPGCSILEVVEACSHGRSWKLFADSINNSGGYSATQCESLDQMRNEKCKGETIRMGYPVPTSARGIYFLKTAAREPYFLM